jgi:hypothetical protein
MQYRKFEKNIPRKGTARPQSQFYIHVSVSDLYIPVIGLPILTDTCMWKLGLRPRKFLFWGYINPNFFAVLINPLLSGIIAARDEESDINFAEKMTQTDLFLPNFLLVSHALTVITLSLTTLSLWRILCHAQCRSRGSCSNCNLCTSTSLVNVSVTIIFNFVIFITVAMNMDPSMRWFHKDLNLSKNRNALGELSSYPK